MSLADINPEMGCSRLRDCRNAVEMEQAAALLSHKKKGQCLRRAKLKCYFCLLSPTEWSEMLTPKDRCGHAQVAQMCLNNWFAVKPAATISHSNEIR
jgi:hypothetical protein